MPPKTTSKPKNAKKTSVVKNKKVVKTPAPVVEPVVESVVEQVVEPVVESVVAPVSTDTVDTGHMNPYVDEFTVLVTELDNALSLIRTLKGRVQKFEKQVNRDHKVISKKLRGRKNRVRDPNAPKSGFAKEGPVSDEMIEFLGLSSGDLISRTDVTKKIHRYCKAHDLQNPEDKRKITPDNTLKSLLRLNKGDELTFFNLQKYMKVHFPNKEGVYPTL